MIDARAVTALLHDAYAEHVAADLTLTAGSRDDSPTAREIREREVYCIRSQAQFVATITLATQGAPAGSRRIYINHLAVLPSARDAGLSGRLLDHAERVARRRTLEQLKRLGGTLTAAELAEWIGLEATAAGNRLVNLARKGYVLRIQRPRRQGDQFIDLRTVSPHTQLFA